MIARVPLTSNLMFSAFAIRRAIGLVAAFDAARPLVLPAGCAPVEGDASTCRIGVTGRDLLRSAVFAVDDVVRVGSIRSMITCSFTTGVTILIPALMPRPSILIALSLSSCALREEADGAAGAAFGVSETGLLSTMVFIVEAGVCAGTLRAAEMRGDDAGAGVGLVKTSVFAIAIDDGCGALVCVLGSNAVTKFSSSTLGGGSAFSISRALRGR